MKSEKQDSYQGTRFSDAASQGHVDGFSRWLSVA